jgi:hypothetical protein
VPAAVVAPARRLIVLGLALLFVLAGAQPAAAGTPILVVGSPSNHFGSYVPEIMRAEGLNAFTPADTSSLNAAALAPYDVVVLGAGEITADHAAALAGWVAGGGNLVALAPDPDLAGLLGIRSAGADLANGYLAVDNTRPPGAGIVGETIQFHGTAHRYTLDGAGQVASLYSDAATPTGNPAVTLRGFGAGEAAAFTFDLAASVVLTRQGNPAWIGQDRDPFAPIRTNDLFFGGAEPNWVDLSKMHVPQADELQRLLANLITYMNRERTPVPRFWYLPRGEKAAVVMTGDDHADGGTEGRFEQYKAPVNSPPGCSVANWECVRSTSYIYTPHPGLTPQEAAAYQAEGFEIALHPTRGGCTNPTPDQFRTVYRDQLLAFGAAYPGVAKPRTSRFHCVSWPDWSTHAHVEVENQIRLDTNYYHYPPAWGDIPGFMTGSGEIMRFAEVDGTPIDLYQAHTHLDDEVLSRVDRAPNERAIDLLLGGATGPQGYYGMFTANMHTDDAESLGSDVIVERARAFGVPVISARQALEWVEGRDGSSFSDVTWGAGRLGFTVNVAAGANGLQGMVPIHSALGALQGLTRDGAEVSVTPQTVKGVDYGFFPAAGGRYEARYPFRFPSTSGPGGPAVLPEANDRTAPRMRLKIPRKIRLRKLLRKGLPYRLTCSEACRVQVRLVMKIRKRSVPVAAKSRRLGGSRGARIVLKPGRKAARKLRRVRPRRLTLRIRVADSFGNARVVTRRIRLVT